MRVDLPAPFSPTMAWISPALTARLTLFSAFTPGKVLVIPRISRMAFIDCLRTPIANRENCSKKFGDSGCLTLGGTLPQPAALAKQNGLESGFRNEVGPRRSGARPANSDPAELLRDLLLLVVAAVDQDLLPVRGIDRDRGQQVGGNDLDLVVVGLGIVHRHFLAAHHRVDHLGGDLRELTGVLVDGRVLLFG